jgi:hypothetical protein
VPHLPVRHIRDQRAKVPRDAIEDELGLERNIKSVAAKMNALPCMYEWSKEGNQIEGGDNQICMLKTTLLLMTDAPITNYHATSVRPYHNVYHASLPYLSEPATSSSSHTSGFRQTDRYRQVLIIKSQLLSTSNLIDPPVSIILLFPTGIISLVTSREIGVKGISSVKLRERR